MMEVQSLIFFWRMVITWKHEHLTNGNIKYSLCPIIRSGLRKAVVFGMNIGEMYRRTPAIKVYPAVHTLDFNSPSFRIQALKHPVLQRDPP